MARKRLSDAQRWQIIGMHSIGMSYKAIRRQTGYHYTVISRSVRKHAAMQNVKDLPRTGRPPLIEDRSLGRLVQRNPFTPSTLLIRQWLPGRNISARTVRNCLKASGLRSKRVIKRPLLTDRHKRDRLIWCRARQNWNLRTLRRILWSDESRFLLHVTDGRTRVWRHRNTAYTPRNLVPTVPFGGGSVMGMCLPRLQDGTGDGQGQR